MKCGNCGTEIKYGDKVCPGCGLPLPKENYKDFIPEEKKEDFSDIDIEIDIENEKNQEDLKTDESSVEPDAEQTAEHPEDEIEDNSEDNIEKNKSKTKKKKTEIVYSDDKLPESEEVIDATFVDIDDDTFKAPSTKVRTKHKLTKGDIITIVIGIVMLVALVVGGIIWFVNRQNKKKVEDNKFGKEEVEGFFDGINEKDEIICYDYVTGYNSDAIFKIADDRIKFAGSFKSFEISNIEIVEKKELKGSFLDSMINKTGSDLDKAYILNITFRYNVDGAVLPAKAIIRTGRTRGNKKWWVVSAEFDDVISAANDFMYAYSQVDADTIIDFFADGVLTDKEKETMRKTYKFVIAPFNFTDIRFNAYALSDSKMSEISSKFADKDRKYSSVIGFTVETYGKNSEAGNNRADFDLVMALDGNQWKVLDIKFLETY